MSARTDYIKKYSDAVIKASEGTGLFASLFMAQAVLESGNGTSSLASKYNNHFGIKADKGWKGKIINLKTREVFNGNDIYIKDGFRWYDGEFESFTDRVKFLQANKRYKLNGVFTAKTPEEQADALQKAGYATSLNYASTLKSIIKANNLKVMDEKKI